VGAETVEAVVRAQLSKALGGKRGMLEAAVPTIIFTLLYVSTRELGLAIAVSGSAAVALLLVRLVQRSSVQFVMNSLFGIAIGALFAWRSVRSGEGDPALAYFLPGIIYNAGYAAVISTLNLVRWPVVGFMVGSVAGDPTAWHKDPRIVRLCSNLSWMLVAPCVLRVLVQTPMYLAGRAAGEGSDAAAWWITALATSKIAFGWPLQLAALAGMVWLLARNHTPIDSRAPEPKLS